MEQSPEHFKGKEAIEHVVEAQANGIIAASEIHGAEIPGHISAGADAARETGLVLLLFSAFFMPFPLHLSDKIFYIAIFAFGWLIWKMGRSAWLAWSRLERLHRIIAEERWEIEHHRQQEREELKALYAAKGFQGKLLEDVLDVLMADGDRLLKVMLEEELGMTLGTFEHPLKQCLGAAIGVFGASIIFLFSLGLFPNYGPYFACFIVIAIGAAVSATYENNKVIPAIIWNLGLAALAFGSVYFLLQAGLHGIIH